MAFENDGCGNSNADGPKSLEKREGNLREGWSLKAAKLLRFREPAEASISVFMLIV
jgi:hypothetical protein